MSELFGHAWDEEASDGEKPLTLGQMQKRLVLERNRAFGYIESGRALEALVEGEAVVARAREDAAIAALARAALSHDGSVHAWRLDGLRALEEALVKERRE